MKKTLLSFLAVGLVSLGILQAATFTTSSPQIEEFTLGISNILNTKDEAYVQKFYTAFDQLIDKYAKSATNAAILQGIKDSLLATVFYAPVGYDTRCYDTSKVRACTLDFTPVCGEDVHTYGNKCELEAVGINLLHEGVCTAADKPTICTMEYAPVCGTDGKTYGNYCGLRASDAGFLGTGTCNDTIQKLSCVHTEKTPATVCTKEFNPVCGTDGETYNNACLAENAGTTVAKTGTCELQKEPRT